MCVNKQTIKFIIDICVNDCVNKQIRFMCMNVCVCVCINKQLNALLTCVCVYVSVNKYVYLCVCVHSSFNYTDELCWGSLWMYKATNESRYLTEAQKYYDPTPDWGMSWDDVIIGCQVCAS